MCKVKGRKKNDILKEQTTGPCDQNADCPGMYGRLVGGGGIGKRKCTQPQPATLEVSGLGNWLFVQLTREGGGWVSSVPSVTLSSR